MRLVINLSMVGKNPTGLGVYSLSCAKVAARFETSIIRTQSLQYVGRTAIEAPSGIDIGGGKLAALKRQVWMRRLRFPDDSLVYSPTHHGLPNQPGQIITIHDMICLRFPHQHFPQYIFFKYFIPRLLKRCRAVFTVSETTRRDIIRTYGYPAERIRVVPNSVDTNCFMTGEVDRRNPYLLMVGARYPHKNVDEVLRNAHLWKDRYRLVVTSCSSSYRATLESLIDQLRIRHRVEFRGYVSRDELLRLYQGCSALVYPSKWEGFGIPPLEAFACSRPVIASDIEIHREVLGDAAIFVQLGDKRSWCSAFEALQDTPRIDEYVLRGRVQVDRYSPRNALDALEASLLAVEPRLESSLSVAQNRIP